MKDLYFKLALRNLFRNPLRTSLNVAILVGCVVGSVLFRGFSNHVLSRIQIVLSSSQTGHLQIAKNIFFEKKPTDKNEERYLDQTEKLSLKIKDYPEVDYVSGRVSFYALLYTRDKVVSARGIAFDPKVEHLLKENTYIIGGEYFSNQTDNEILLGSGIQKQLDLKPGQTLTLVSSTLAGSANALDPEFRGTFQTAFSEIDNTTFFIPLSAALRLLDTLKVENLLVFLKDMKHVPEFQSHLEKDFSSEAGLGIRSWRQLADLFIQVEDFYKTQNAIIEGILLLFVFLAILNTLSMTVFERLGEIGTLRSLGDTPKDITKIFLVEGFLMVAIACAMAVPISYTLATAINQMHLPMTLPGSSRPTPFAILPLGKDFLLSFVLCFAASLLAIHTALRKALKTSIVDALRQNI